MSGTNPFRRKNTGEQSFSSPVGPVNNAFLDRPEARIPQIDTDLPRVPKTKTGKTVRIISPHSASSDTENGTLQHLASPQRGITSPPPSGPASTEISDEEYPEDPFEAESYAGGGSAQDDGTLQNTLRISGGIPTQKPKGIPANPFAKTLASLNTEIQPSLPTPSSERLASGAEPKAARPLRDMDDFKNLLLTGAKSTTTANASTAPPVSFQSQPSIGDTNSNTDASSISRQSIFEPIAGPLQESPRTSHEGSPSDDERQQLVGDPSQSPGKPKPPAPPHRHGKLVKASGPQTVSFEDPTLSFTGSSANTLTSSDATTLTSPVTPSGVAKPLPALPLASEIGLTAENLSGDVETAKRRSFSGSPDMQASPTPQKRNVPPPPLARRHSLRPKPFAAPERSTTISEEGPAETGRRSSSPSSITPKLPPPPPPRRSGLTRGNSSSSISTSASIGPTSQPSASESATSSPKPRAPAPPSSSPTLSAVKRQLTQPLPGSPSMAPPPPPRRRGSSASNNYTPSRLSGNYSVAAGRMRSDSGASSISQLQMTSPSPNSAESKDVMADLTALQREVDELRGKFKD